MHIKLLLVGLCLMSLLSISCDNTLQCERHYFVSGFKGTVIIYFNQNNGQRNYEDGCKKYEIPVNGKCFSAFPFIEGTSYPGETLRFFERISKDSVIEISEFFERDYLMDTINNKGKKYVFIVRSGYEKPFHIFQYDVDYGKNYKDHIYY